MVSSSELQLWRFIVDLLQCLPPPVYTSLMQFILKTSFTPDQATLLTGLILSSCRNPRIIANTNCKNILKMLINSFEVICGHQQTTNNLELKITILLNLLKIILQFTNQETLSMDQSFQQLLFSDFPGDSTLIDIDRKVDDQHFYLDNIEQLLNVFKMIMSAISFDEWIGSSEVASNLVLQISAEVRYWPVETAAPSNMQRLIAHHQALCCEALEVRLEIRNACLET